ncbi:MAG: AAA family ATPase [Planctomycetes bacterium]|nr:AAA family ATPase [Planctomycetota bacterium]MCW8139686.1 AAA family ATPase [Planctomycetota bacterium]
MARQPKTKPKPSSTTTQPRVRAVPLSQVEPEEARYLVEPYLPLGSLCLLEGDPGAGKSYVAAAIGAALTRGKVPDLGIHAVGTVRRPRTVLYLTTEDKQSTLRARFAGQDGDLERVLGVSDHLSLRDPEPLRELVEEHKPALIVVDPIHALLEGVNMTSANAVRVALTPLVKLAAERDVCVLAIRHLAKAGRGRAIYRGLGSIDFSAAARSVLRIGQDPSGVGGHVLVHVKNSLGPLGASVEFEIDERHLVWLGRSELTARDLDARPQVGRGRSAVELAESFVEEQLQGGPRPAAEVREAAASAGIAERTLERAQKRLGVTHLRMNAGGRGQGHWVWSLPPACERGSLEGTGTIDRSSSF